MAAKKQSQLKPVYTIAIIVCMIILFDAWYAEKRYQTFRGNYLDTIRNEVELISETLYAQLEALKKRTRLFTDINRERIAALAADPANEKLLQTLQYQLQQLLPGALGFNMVDENGNSFHKQIASEVDEDCGEEVSAGLSSHDFTRVLRIHKQPFGHHFDIAVDWLVETDLYDELKGRFIVSFSPAILARILSKRVNKSNELYLLLKDVNGLIEVSELGSRNVMDRSKRLGLDELERIGYR